jgi:hypothetical protein
MDAFPQPPSEPTEGMRRSRRGLIAGALALLGGEALARAKPARAGTDGDVVLGGFNSASGPTSIAIASGAGANDAFVVEADFGGVAVTASNVDASHPAVQAVNTGAGPGLTAHSHPAAASSAGEGVYAQSGNTDGTTPGHTRNGVHGVTDSPSDSGVWGENVNGGYGVFGSTSTSGIGGGAGAAGLNNGSGPGVRGASQSGAGVLGYGGTSEGVYARSGGLDGTSPGATRNGVHGVTNSSSDSGVWGENVAGGYGVFGSTSTSGIGGAAGIAGLNNGSGPGLRGASQNGAGIYGFAANSEGLYARSGNTDGTTPGTTRSGVHGVTDSASAAAVWGENTGLGEGVKGSSASTIRGTGVHGLAAAAAGVGVLAENTAGGLALHANGPAQFDARVAFARSGSVVIPSGHKTFNVTPPGGVTASTLVLALLQNVSGGVMVKAAVPNPATGSFQIVLNKAPLAPASATIAWFILN